jgi:hypothetical protein
MWAISHQLSEQFTYHYDAKNECVHLVPKHSRETVCGEVKVGWRRVPRQAVDCTECIDHLRAEMIREADGLLGYEKHPEIEVWWNRRMDQAVTEDEMSVT